MSTRETLEDLSIGVNRSALAGGGNTERIVPVNPIVRYAHIREVFHIGEVCPHR